MFLAFISSQSPFTFQWIPQGVGSRAELHASDRIHVRIYIDTVPASIFLDLVYGQIQADTSITGGSGHI
jgi:hypothetical protein